MSNDRAKKRLEFEENLKMKRIEFEEARKRAEIEEKVHVSIEFILIYRKKKRKIFWL